MTAEKFTPREAQQYRIDRILAEPTRAALLADDMGVGKTLVATEIVLQGDFERVLIIGVKDVFGHFAENFTRQSEGAATLRRLDSTKKGQDALADFLAGKPGYYFSGSQYITAQDWDHVPAFNDDGTPKFKIVKSTGEVETKPATISKAPVLIPRSIDEIGPWMTPRMVPQIGPALLPTRESKRVHLGTYKKMKPLDLIIVDEVHIMAANRKNIGRRTLLTIKAGFKLAMSGTWFGNLFDNAWSICRWLWPETVDASFIRWKREWCATDTVYVKGGKAQDVVVGEREPGKWVSTLPCYIRAEADEKAPPATEVYVDLTAAQRAQYQDLENDLLTWVEDRQSKGIQPLVADIPIVLRQRLRTATLGEMSFNEDGEIGFSMESKSAKLTALRGILDLWEGQKVIIFTDSKRFAKVTVARLQRAGYKAVEWSGDVSSKQRDAIKESFTSEGGEVQYIVAVIAALSTGYDGLQKVCNRMIWLSESESVIENAQAQARLFRPGRTLANGGFMEVKILARDTHDVGIYSRLITRHAGINTSLAAPRMAA